MGKYQGVGGIYSYETKKGIRWKYIINRTKKHDREVKGGFLKAKQAARAKVKAEERLEKEGLLGIKDITVEGLYGKFIKDKQSEGIRGNTVVAYRTAYRRMLLDFKDCNVSKITVEDLQEQINKALKESTYKTMVLRRTFIKLIFNYAVENKYLTDNIAESLKINKNKCKQSNVIEIIRPKHLNFFFSELKKYLKEIENKCGGKKYIFEREYLFFALMSLTGMRISEALALEWDDFDFEERSVHVSKAYKLIDRKKEISDAKTDDTIRKTFVFVDEFWDILKEWKIKQQKINRCKKKMNTDIIFSGTVDSFPLDTHFYRTISNSFVKKYKEFEKLSGTKYFRHTLISILAKHDVNRTKAKFFVGHTTSDKSAHSDYIHLDDDDRIQIAVKISELYDNVI